MKSIKCGIPIQFIITLLNKRLLLILYSNPISYTILSNEILTIKPTRKWYHNPKPASHEPDH